MISSANIETDSGPLLIRWKRPFAIVSIHLPEEANAHERVMPVPDWLRGLSVAVKDYYLGVKVDFSSVCNYFASSESMPYLDASELTRFSRHVYAAVSKLRYGEVASYGDIACLIGRPKSARAVGRAMSANPFPLLVPCHRVVSANGLGGFSGGFGVELKRQMLALEGIQIG